jgi:hypothetical protein
MVDDETIEITVDDERPYALTLRPVTPADRKRLGEEASAEKMSLNRYCLTKLGCELRPVRDKRQRFARRP